MTSFWVPVGASAAIVLCGETVLWRLFSRHYRKLMLEEIAGVPAVRSRSLRKIGACVVAHVAITLMIVSSFLLWTW